MIAANVPLAERNFFTYEEFGQLAGVTKQTVYMWVKKGYLRAVQFSPKCVMISRAELERYERGEMMNPPGVTGEVPCTT
jgi:excisionase family DNA binding protein